MKHRFSVLYGKRIFPRRIAMRAGCFVAAFFLAYLLCVFVPYTVTVRADGYLASHPYESFFGAGSDERALVLPADEESFFTRLVLAERADTSIDVATYNFSNDDGARHFIAALVSAADRGVRVRLFTDAKMSGLGKIDGGKAKDLLAAATGVELYEYNPVNLFDPAMLPVSMHDKLYLTDGETLIVGGANIGFHHFVDNDDLEALVSDGDTEYGAAAQAEEYFGRLIASPLTVRRTAKMTAKLETYKAKLLGGYKAYYDGSPFSKTRDYRAEGVAVHKITLVTNPIEGKKRAPNVLEALFMLAEHSDRVHFRTPYYALTDGYTERLTAMAEGKSAFILSTNSLYNTPNMAFGVYLKNRKKLLTPSLTLYEYQGARQNHGKAAAFDDRLSAVGSFNLDERSAHIDTEMMLIIDSEPFNAALRAELNRLDAQSLAVGPDNRYRPGDVPARDVSAGKKVLYGFYGWFFDPFINLI